MPAVVIESQDHLRIDADSLSFLVESPDPNSIVQTLSAESTFFRLLSGIDSRNQMIFTEVNTSLNEAGIKEGTILTREQYEEILTHGVFMKFESLSEAIIERVSQCESEILKAAKALSKATKGLYPDQKVASIGQVDSKNSRSTTSGD